MHSRWPRWVTCGELTAPAPCPVLLTCGLLHRERAGAPNLRIPKDTLQFNATPFSNSTSAMNAASQVGADTVFAVDANDTVTLDNVTKTSLTAGNFHFV